MVRKRKPDEPIALQVRMTEGLRAQLAEAAQGNGRSLNSEILWRLGQSFGTDEHGIRADAQDARLRQTIREVVAEHFGKQGKERGDA